MSGYHQYDKYYSKPSNNDDSKWFFWMLFLVFLILKLSHVIDWSWWWVTLPLWGVAAFVIVCLGLIKVIEWCIVFRDKMRKRK